MTELELLEKIKISYRAILCPKLVGIYVHGSLAFGCFRWESSDIDFVVVVSELLSQSEKEALLSALLELDAYAPPKGFEMSVVLEGVCNSFLYPTPFELHFSNTHKDRCREDLSQYCQTMNGTDKDLAAHFTVIHHVGQVLYGKPIPEVFGEVPRSDYLDSIQEDVRDASKDIVRQPAYYILNLCRILAYLQDGLVLSKEQGGRWGIRNCDEEYGDLIQSALSAYLGTGQVQAAPSLIQSFASDMLKQIL